MDIKVYYKGEERDNHFGKDVLSVELSIGGDTYMFMQQGEGLHVLTVNPTHDSLLIEPVGSVNTVTLRQGKLK